MSGSLFDYTQYDPTMGGSGPAGVPGAGTPPTTLATMWDWLRRQQSPITGLAPGQQMPSGLAMSPDRSVSPMQPVDPTTAAPPVPAPQSPMAAAMTDPYRNAPSPASIGSAPGWGVATAGEQANAPPPPTPDQAAQSAKDTSGANYNTDVQQANQPAQAPNPNAHPADYSSATPPPDAGMALVVQNAAKKYGVPLEVANWVGFHESNWNTKVGTNSYGATGPWQFKKATADQYGLTDPNDFNASTDAAMHLLADNYKKTGNWADAVQSYGTFSTGTGKDEEARNGFLQYAQNANLPNLGKGTQVAGPGAGTSGSDMAPQQQSQLSALGIDPSTFKLPFDYNQAVQPSMSEKLYRMAAALQGNAGQAAGLMAGDRQKMMEANNNQLATQRLLGTLAYQNAGLGIRQQVANNGTDRVGIAQQTANNGTDRVGVAQQQANTAAGRLKVSQDILTGKQSGSLADAAASGKDSAADRNNLFKSTAQDHATMQDNAEALRQLDQNPQFFGNGAGQTITRMLAQQGITTGGNDLDAASKALATSRNQYLTGLFNGHVGPLRAFQADKMFAAAQADLTTRPEAAKWIVNMNQYALQTKDAWRQKAQELYSNPETRDQVEGGNYASTEGQFYDAFMKANPIPQYQGSSPSAPAPKPGVNADGSTKGAATLRYDQATGRMVPM